MTSKDLQDLKQSALLALKAYFVCSLEGEYLQNLNVAQIFAATSMHQAVSDELNTRQEQSLPHGVAASIENAIKDLTEARSQHVMPMSRVDEAILRLRKILKLFNKKKGSPKSSEQENGNS